MIVAFLLLATVALIVLKAAGILAISWLIALIPAIILLALGLLGAVVMAVLAAIGKRQMDKADADFAARNVNRNRSFY